MEHNLSNQIPLVIVIPTKNRRVLLERALESVRTQKYDAYRIVIIDDGSNDGTREYLDTIKSSVALGPRITVIHHEKSRGVNAARNAAFKTLKEGEWAVPLDDDDMLLPNILEAIAHSIANLPPHIQLICFNAITRTSEEEYTSGYIFGQGQVFFDPTYQDFMMGIPSRGDMRMVSKWTLFPKYLFEEDINGFEGEWALLVARDNIGIRFLPEQTTLIDQIHGGEQLSKVAGKRDPASFVRAHRRIFRTHAVFFKTHPDKSMSNAMSAMKLSVRALDVLAGLYFLGLYIRGLIQLFLSTQRFKK